MRIYADILLERIFLSIGSTIQVRIWARSQQGQDSRQDRRTSGLALRDRVVWTHERARAVSASGGADGPVGLRYAQDHRAGPSRDRTPAVRVCAMDAPGDRARFVPAVELAQVRPGAQASHLPRSVAPPRTPGAHPASPPRQQAPSDRSPSKLSPTRGTRFAWTFPCTNWSCAASPWRNASAGAD